MSVHVESWASRQATGLPARKLVLLALASNANDDGWVRWPQPQLPLMCEVSAKTFAGHVEKLVEAGLIVRQEDWLRLAVPWKDEQ